MCGIFGLIRSGNGDAEAAVRSTQAFLTLGAKSEERGTDSSGIAALVARTGRIDATAPAREDLAAKLALIDQTVIYKDTIRFRDLDIAALAESLPAGTSILMGHTRWATQGNADDLVNSSPLLAGNLIGTHNGDIDVKSVPNHKTYTARAIGETDTERLLLAISDVSRDRSQITKILKSVVGRASLAFIDRGRTSRLYLARTALSPIAYAWTPEGDFLYASNPDWFRQIETETNGVITFRDITLVPEGHLITVNTLTAQVIDVRRFTPTCRERDLALLNTAVYKRFTPEDKTVYAGLSRHRVKPAKLSKTWPELTAAPAVTCPAADSTAVTLFDDDLPDGFIIDEIVDYDEVEALCWASGEFDMETFEAIIDCDDEDEAVAMVTELRARVEAAAGAAA